jgi:hypothetical protein
MIANPVYGGVYAYGKTGVAVRYDFRAKERQAARQAAGNKPC